MARRRPNFAPIPPPPQEGLSERELAFYTAVKQNIEMLTSPRSEFQAGTGGSTATTTTRNRVGTIGVTEPPQQFSSLVTLSDFVDQLNVQIAELNQQLVTLNNDLDNLVIDETKISDYSISTPKLQALSILAEKIAAGAITTNKIAAGAVTANKITVDELAAISARTGTLTSDLIRTAPAGNRLELTSPEVDNTFAIWGGDTLSNRTGSITNAVKTSGQPVVITSENHSLETGSNISITGVVGMTQLNGNGYTITKIDGDSFSLDGTSSLTFSAYISGGLWRYNTGLITDITNANPARVESESHSLLTGDIIGILDVGGMEEINNKLYTITRINSDLFTLNGVDSTDFVEYTSGGVWYKYAKDADNGRFWVKHNGDAKFGGRIFANQLEGSILDAVPISVQGALTTSSTPGTWVTVGNRIVEIPALIQRPRRPFMTLSVNVFGVGSDGAQIRGEIQFQNDDGTWPGTWEVVDEGVVNTIGLGNVGCISGGSLNVGNRGFRIRVRFSVYTSGQTAEANEFTGLFMGLPAGNGVNILEDSNPSTVISTTPADTTILIPPNFDVGWLDEP